jgi:hypothetical protein
MPDDEGKQPEEVAPSDQSPPSDLPKASDVLARPSLVTDPLNDLDPDHKRRYYEAAVKKLEIEAKQADDDRGMRKDIAERVFKAISVQVIIADLAFLIYGFWNGWEIPAARSAHGLALWLFR